MDIDVTQFEMRKMDHIQKALDPRTEALGGSGLDSLRLAHDALPEVDLREVDIETDFLGKKVTPFFVASMTAGHFDARYINLNLAEACQKRRWIMGVGSQRRELDYSSTIDPWKDLRSKVDGIQLISNIGLSQAIVTPTEKLERLISSIGAVALFVHTNPLQEALQLEGTPNFRNGLQTLARLAQELSVPVILKETGCGFALKTLKKLSGLGLLAVDISGFGGTHWGRIEGERANRDSRTYQMAQTFSNWGVPTAQVLMAAAQHQFDFELWASGGARSGLDAAKLMALGAKRVGFARPLLKAALISAEAVEEEMIRIEEELKVALFCCGKLRPSELTTNDILTPIEKT